MGLPDAVCFGAQILIFQKEQAPFPLTISRFDFCKEMLNKLDGESLQQGAVVLVGISSLM